MSEANLNDVKFTGKGDDAALAKKFIDSFGDKGIKCSVALFKAFEAIAADKAVSKEIKVEIAAEVQSLKELSMLTFENQEDWFPGSLEAALS